MSSNRSATNYFPEGVVERMFHFLTSHRDRNAVSLVCKSWYGVERFSRDKVLVCNCYAVNPERVIARFPRLVSLSLKGRPRCVDSRDWGGYAHPWVEAMVKGGIDLEELRLKRMVVSDQSLKLLAKNFPNLKSLVLVCCNGFTTDGVAAVAAGCRFIRELDLQESVVNDHRAHWLNSFPESSTSLVSLNFACLKGRVDVAALVKLVARCPNLTSLKLNRGVPLTVLQKILAHAPQLNDLRVDTSLHQPFMANWIELRNSIRNSRSIRRLSVFLHPIQLYYLPALIIYPICANLTYLNLIYSAAISTFDLAKLISRCKKLEKLWITDSIGDTGLGVVATTCKALQELRVFESNQNRIRNAGVSERGLVDVSAGCPKLNSVVYFCGQMTNAALIAVAKNCPALIRFKLHLINEAKPDAVIDQPLDEGYGAIVQSSKGLKRLSVSGLLTDRVFLYIGMYAEQLEMLSVAHAGESNNAMLFVLNGCKKLKKLEIRSCPFGNISDVDKHESLRSFWMWDCGVTLGACKALAETAARLSVEVIHQNGQIGGGDDEDLGGDVKNAYVYRTLDGPRKDAPGSVWIL